ncbi:MAG: adenylate kinase [Clostridia bacterium]|nr:adenylate kinase [Clostridia bacterium]
MKIILLGAPASGKGTLTGNIKKEFSAAHISTGDMLRDNISRGTELGMKAKEYMDGGKLVPDELIIGLAKDRLMQDDCKENFILDGFPRTINQADALALMLDELGISLDGVININVPRDVLVSRITGRRVCPKCGASYHIETMKSKVEGICDECGSNLIHRDDDNEEVFGKRLNEYNEMTAPLIDYYKERNLLIDMPYIADANELFIEVKKALGK